MTRPWKWPRGNREVDVSEPDTLLKRVEKLTARGQQLMASLDEMKAEGPKAALFAEGFAILLQEQIENFLGYRERLNMGPAVRLVPPQALAPQPPTVDAVMDDGMRPGDKFGELVLREYKRGAGVWQCECLRCGNKEVLFRPGNLRQRKNPTCGCRNLNGQPRNFADHPARKPTRPIAPGDKFGALEAIEISDRQWKVRCGFCEKTALLPSSSLRDRRNPSCGCKSLSEIRALGLAVVAGQGRQPAYTFVDGKWTELQPQLDVASDEELNEGDEP